MLARWNRVMTSSKGAAEARKCICTLRKSDAMPRNCAATVRKGISMLRLGVSRSEMREEALPTFKHSLVRIKLRDRGRPHINSSSRTGLGTLCPPRAAEFPVEVDNSKEGETQEKQGAAAVWNSRNDGSADFTTAKLHRMEIDV